MIARVGARATLFIKLFYVEAAKLVRWRADFQKVIGAVTARLRFLASLAFGFSVSFVLRHPTITFCSSLTIMHFAQLAIRTAWKSIRD